MNVYLENLGVLSQLKELNNVGSCGQLRKWSAVLSNGTLVYIKGHSRNGYECESECIACRLAVMLGIQNVVIYDMDVLHIGNKKYKVCVSSDFVQGGIYNTVNSLLPDVVMLKGQEKYEYIQSNLSLGVQLDNILLFDAIILNKDRHLRNLGVLNGCIMPLFDNGDSLFSNKTVSYIYKVLKTNLDYQPCKPFFSTFTRQLYLLRNISIGKVERISVYGLVNTYLSGKRAKYVGKLLIMRLEGFGLLCQ